MDESRTRQTLHPPWPKAHPGSIILTNVKCRTRPFCAGCSAHSCSCQGVMPWVARRSVQNERGFLNARLLGCALSSDRCFRHGSIHSKHGHLLGRRLPCRRTPPLPDHAALAALPNARFANAQELAGALASADTRLLVLPYGSSFPEEAWPAIYAYLQRGGNLLTVGGRPFSQAAYRECGANNVCAWKLRYPRNAWSKALYHQRLHRDARAQRVCQPRQ